MGVGGALVALLSGLISLTVLPALLVLLGTRVNALAPTRLQRRRDRESSVIDRRLLVPACRKVVMRFPGRIALATSARADRARSCRRSGSRSTSRTRRCCLRPRRRARSTSVLRADFPPYRDTPVTLAVSGDTATAARVAAAAAGVRGVAVVRPRSPWVDDLSAVEVISSAPPLSQASKDMVRGLRVDRRRRGDRVHRRIPRPPVEPARPPADRDRADRRDHAGRAVPLHRLADPAVQAARHEPARDHRRVRDPRD